MFRRRLPPELEGPRAAFLDVVGSVERAKAALAEAAPTTRYAGRPLAEVLFAFEQHLHDARDRMAAWRAADLEREWEACREGLERGLELAERLRLEVGPPEGFEALVATLGDLMAPLEALEAAEARFRALRR